MALLVANLVLTSALAGLIWTIQVVHYPLFVHADGPDFQRFHARHSTLISRVVIPLMAGELVAAAALALFPPAGLASPAYAALGWVALGLVVGVWVVTALVQVPQHARLSQGFCPQTHRRLVRGNWLRTLLWTARCVVLVVMTSAAM